MRGKLHNVENLQREKTNLEEQLSSSKETLISERKERNEQIDALKKVIKSLLE